MGYRKESITRVEKMTELESGPHNSHTYVITQSRVVASCLGVDVRLHLGRCNVTFIWLLNNLNNLLSDRHEEYFV